MTFPDAFKNEIIVLDTDSRYTYVGRLEDGSDGLVRLIDAAVYNADQAMVPLDQYLDECAVHGHAVSRRQVLVHTDKIVSGSLLSDIIKPGADIDLPLT